MNCIGETTYIKQAFVNLDIGGTNTATIAGGTAAANHWFVMNHAAHFTGVLTLGPTWNTGDSLGAVVLQQAQDSAGTGLKTVKTFTLADSLLDTAGQTAIFEMDASELDSANDFNYVRIKVSMTDNTDVDNISCIYVASELRFTKPFWDLFTKRFPQDQAAD